LPGAVVVQMAMDCALNQADCDLPKTSGETPNMPPNHPMKKENHNNSPDSMNGIHFPPLFFEISLLITLTAFLSHCKICYPTTPFLFFNT
jgi:hypothetical protein